jgi:negative regulator of flagellin synthesis FlgM
MIDSISNSQPPANRQQKAAATDSPSSISVQSENAKTDAQVKGKIAETTDNVKLSELAAKALNNAEFDQEKTTRIKEAIEQGNYPLDHKRLAESFLALEQLISDQA